MQAVSRESVATVGKRFIELTASLNSSALRTQADELDSVVKLLNDQVALRKHLAARVDDAAPKQELVARLLTGKVSAPVVEIVRTAVGQRWGSGRDLTDAIETFSRLSTLIDAERAGQIDNVEDELFRVGRTLAINPELSRLLSDNSTPSQGRLDLLNRILAGRASEWTQRLLDQAVSLGRGRDLATVVPELAELAAERRGQGIAHVIAAAPLTSSQLSRLETVLSRIYGRTMSVQLDIDPEILGGLKISVGDEVVDGTILSRLYEASAGLPQ